MRASMQTEVGTTVGGSVTFARMRNGGSNGPSGRRAFREHVAGCDRCRLTAYTGSRATHAHDLTGVHTDCGDLCATGFDLYVKPEFLREVINQRGPVTLVEATMRAMGFPSERDLSSQ